VTQLPQRLPAKASQPQSASEDAEVTENGASPTTSAQAPASPKRVPLNAANMIRLNYGYPQWNKNSTKIDSASLLMRDGATGRVVQIHLEETEPDSSIFSGVYSIKWQDVEKLQVEFFIPPQELLVDEKGLKKVTTMIQNGELKRRPFIVRRAPNGQQSVELFDTREQAYTAMKAYKAEQQLAAQVSQGPKKFPTDDQVEAARVAAELKAKAVAAAAAAERMRLEQLAAREKEEALARQQALQESERKARAEQAAKLAQEALADYNAGRYTEAKQKFDKAIELDPSNKNYYFQYGVALYKTDDFNKALVFLNMADGAGVNTAEKMFFVGLSHFRLKEFTSAATAFDKVAAAKNPDLSPSAQFYKGVALFELQKYAEAQPAFQAVLDTSKDPALDERAEAYVEQILRIMQFEAERSRKWQFSATIGEQYDSNVILSSDSARDAGSATNIEGYRTLLQGSGRYRPVYDEKHEFAVQLDLMGMFTVDKSFQSAQTLRNADPMMYTLTAPWSYKGLVAGRGYKFDAVPGYEGIWMSLEGDTNKEIINSYLLNLNNLFVMSDTWFANVNLEMRRDNSKLSSSTGDDDATANKVKLAQSNLFFVSADKSKILTADGGITMNLAQGKNNTYQRYDLAVGWIQPFYWDTSINTKLGYYLQSYPDRTTARTDNDVSVSAGLSKKLSEKVSAGFTANYTVNQSTDESNTYKKWSGMLTLSALNAF
jgi:tetratricopeptide (TPR) repeat protein